MTAKQLYVLKIVAQLLLDRQQQLHISEPDYLALRDSLANVEMEEVENESRS